MTVSKEQAMVALQALTHWVGPNTPSETTLRQFIEQSQDSGHAAAPTDELRGLADWLCAEASKLDDAPWRNDPIVLSHVFTLRNWAKAVRALAAPAPTQQPAMRYDVLYEIAATFSLDYNAVCKVAHSLSVAAPTPQPEHQQLMKFYGVTTLEALVDKQAHHVERLQAKLPPTPDVFAPQRVREG